MTKRGWIEEQVCRLSDEEFVNIWNRYCDDHGTPDCQIYHMDEFNDMFKDLVPADIADMVACGKFNINDDYFVVLPSCVRSDCDAKYLVDQEELVDDILDNIDFYDFFLSNDDYEEFIKSEVFYDDETAFKFFMEWFHEEYIEGTKIIEFDLDDILSEFQEAHP